MVNFRPEVVAAVAAVTGDTGITGVIVGFIIEWCNPIWCLSL